MGIDGETIQEGLCELGLQGQDVAVHSSLKSFGRVSGGARAVLHALLDVCGTAIMPAFCEIGRTNPPPDDRPLRNGWDYQNYRIETAGITPFDPHTFDETSELNVDEMGRIPAEFLKTSGTVRSKHPSVSWAANGPLAGWYVSNHGADDPNLPLKRLQQRQGHVLLLGVGLEACTAVHLGEEIAGRRPFIRWILYADGAIRRVREYGCSDGFAKLEPFVSPFARRASIGQCQAVAYPIGPFVDAVARAITAQPELTLCDRKGPCRCQDALKGGPIDQAGPVKEVT
jgi:aminoglycoside 3-N-acetyltransferase